MGALLLRLFLITSLAKSKRIFRMHAYKTRETTVIYCTTAQKKNTAPVSPYTQKINEHSVYIPYLNQHYINCITTCQCVIFYVYRLKSWIKLMVKRAVEIYDCLKWSGPEFSRSFVQTLIVRHKCLPDRTKTGCSSRQKIRYGAS